MEIVPIPRHRIRPNQHRADVFWNIRNFIRARHVQAEAQPVLIEWIDQATEFLDQPGQAILQLIHRSVVRFDEIPYRRLLKVDRALSRVEAVEQRFRFRGSHVQHGNFSGRVSGINPR